MKVGRILICLAGGLALCAVARADTATNVNVNVLRQNRALFLKKLHERHHFTGMPGRTGMPDMRTPFTAGPGPGFGLPQPDHGVVVAANHAPTVQADTDDLNDPYAFIVKRNVFGLNPIPVVDPNAQPPGPPPPKITLTGITTIFGPAEALFKVAGVVREGRKPEDESYIFTEGEAEDEVSVTTIDVAKNTVTFNNHGEVQVIPLTDGSASSGGAPASPSWPGRDMGGPGGPRRFGRGLGGYGGQNFGRPGGFQRNFGGGQQATPQLTGDDQQAYIAAERAAYAQQGSAMANLLPPTKYDQQASQELGGGSGAPMPP